MQHLFEILRILDGAINQDYGKVVAFAKSLATKLEEDGEHSAAKKVRVLLTQSKTLELTTTRGTNLNAVPLDGESKLALANREDFDPSEITVFHEEDARQRIEKFIKYVKHSSELESKGLELNPSILLYGPPGCGKSETAKYIAAKLGLPLVTARLDSIMSSYLGSTAKNLRSLFNFADRERCVLFLDEFDAIAKIRDDSQELGELKRVVVSLLQNIDYLDKGTILIAATNHDHLLDSAVWRRFSYKLRIGPPSEELRFNLFRQNTLGFSKDIDCKRYSELSEGLTGSDIKTICAELKRETMLEGGMAIEPGHMIREIVFHRFYAELDSKPQLEKIKFLRSKYGKSITLDNIAQMFGISKATVSNSLK